MWYKVSETSAIGHFYKLVYGLRNTISKKIDCKSLGVILVIELVPNLC